MGPNGHRSELRRPWPRRPAATRTEARLQRGRGRKEMPGRDASSSEMREGARRRRGQPVATAIVPVGGGQRGEVREGGIECGAPGPILCTGRSSTARQSRWSRRLAPGQPESSAGATMAAAAGARAGERLGLGFGRGSRERERERSGQRRGGPCPPGARQGGPGSGMARRAASATGARGGTVEDCGDRERKSYKNPLGTF